MSYDTKKPIKRIDKELADLIDDLSKRKGISKIAISKLIAKDYRKKKEKNGFRFEI